MLTISKTLISFMLLATGVSGAAALDQYANHPVRMIVPNAAGGLTDLLARMLGKGLTSTWGHPVVVENRPGADEMLGIEEAAKSAPDGYTLLVVEGSALTAGPHLHNRMRYDPLKSLTPILSLGQVTPVMVVPSSLPANTVAEFIALAKSRPGALNYASFGNGTYAHLAMEDFKRRTGTNMLHIPYNGSAPAITALMRNDVSVLIVNESQVDGHVKAGTLKILAAASAKRSTLFPNLPTVAESGVPGFATGAWWVLVGPANLPRAIVDKIGTDANGILDTEQTQELYTKFTMEKGEVAPNQLSQIIQDDFTKTGTLVKAIGLQPH